MHPAHATGGRLRHVQKPKVLVTQRWQSRFYQFWYKNYLDMSDEAIDKLPRLPIDTHLMGQRSSFLDDASKHPEEYTNLSKTYKFIGYLIAGMLLIVIALMAWGIASGRMLIRD